MTDTRQTDSRRRPCEYTASGFPVAAGRDDTPVPFYCGRLDYADGLAIMHDLRQRRRASQVPDTVLYLEHEAVVTYGRATQPADLYRRPHTMPCVEVERGGQATWHGPGQLVGYCVIDLCRRAGGRRPDLHEFIRAIESAIAGYLSRAHGLPAIVRPGHTGVWIDARPQPRKIASIGISVRRWISAHGFALNVHNDLDAFEAIVPCGDAGASMTSIRAEVGTDGGAQMSPARVAGALHPFLRDELRGRGWCGND